MATFNNTQDSVKFLTENNLWSVFFTETTEEINGYQLQVITKGDTTGVKVSENGNFIVGMVSYDGKEVSLSSDNINTFNNELQ